ncbi:MAG TPA: hypothetical protein VEI02_17215 [Planctomycetota bacterium]|nr:hypothetical protein [Planctomycetota bacterium]
MTSPVDLAVRAATTPRRTLSEDARARKAKSVAWDAMRVVLATTTAAAAFVILGPRLSERLAVGVVAACGALVVAGWASIAVDRFVKPVRLLASRPPRPPILHPIAGAAVVGAAALAWGVAAFYATMLVLAAAWPELVDGDFGDVDRTDRWNLATTGGVVLEATAALVLATLLLRDRARRRAAAAWRVAARDV